MGSTSEYRELTGWQILSTAVGRTKSLEIGRDKFWER
jgi:hypothetical protein